jgi:hypothetical protein
MGMFDSFLGQDTGYTKTQSTGLRRSAEIKKRRKEDERAFERKQEKSKTQAALTERRIVEAGETQRAGMTVAGGTEERRMANVGQMARQRLIGEQERGAATTKAFREADVKSMEYGRGLTTADIKHGRDVELAETKAKDSFAKLFESPSGAARSELPGNQKEYTFSQFTGLNREKQTEYMAHMKSKDPKKYLDFARQYKLLSSPGEGAPNVETSGRSIYQSDSGTYRNF